MTAKSSAAASKSKGAAARAEKNGRREMDFEGLKVSLPPKLPASFSYRFSKIAAMEERDEMTAAEAYNLVERIVGAEQLDVIADHVDTLDRDDVGLVPFLFRIVGEYGNEPGESQASAKS